MSRGQLLPYAMEPGTTWPDLKGEVMRAEQYEAIISEMRDRADRMEEMAVDDFPMPSDPQVAEVLRRYRERSYASIFKSGYAAGVRDMIDVMEQMMYSELAE